MDLPKYIRRVRYKWKKNSEENSKKRTGTWREIKIFCSAVFFFFDLFTIASLMSLLSMSWLVCDLCTIFKSTQKMLEKKNNNKASAVNINNDDVTWWCISPLHTTILETGTHSCSSQTEQFFLSSRCCWLSDGDDKKDVFCVSTDTHRRRLRVA